MVVYADLIFLLNGCIDFLLLWLTSGIRKKKTTFVRMLVASVIGGTYSALYLWSRFSVIFLFPIKIVISIIMVAIAFGMRRPMSFIRTLFTFYLICFLTGGAMVAAHYLLIGDSNFLSGSLFTEYGGWGSPVSWVFVVLGFPLVWLYTKFSFQSLSERQSIYQHVIPIFIRFGKCSIECIGLIDTGNQLRDPLSRTPVTILELDQIKDWIPQSLKHSILTGCYDDVWKSLPDEWISRIRVVPYRSAGRKGDLMIVMKPDEVKVLPEGKEWHIVDKVLIGIDVGLVSSDGSFQAIIHPSCLAGVHAVTTN